MQLAQAVNLLNRMVLPDLALGSPLMLHVADQILQQVPTVLVLLIAISQVATSQAHLAQSRMLLEARNAHQSSDPDLIQDQPVLAQIPVRQNLAPPVPNQWQIVLNQGLIVRNPRALNPNPRVQNLIDLQSLNLQVQNQWVLRVGHVRSPVVEVQKAGNRGRDLAARPRGPRALKRGLIYKTAEPTLQI